ncbi:sugar transferase [Tessaracoccus caeni]|uniref:sugar transferase n=1 Tax=Tessaracoccus caeni TaxID=3031239 RepID=UPI0023DAC7AB|nr:sugar transferase [Tessaracoccus caeni]MDF1487581.1 sugar transferase [Tessaracoccus caeni]
MAEIKVSATYLPLVERLTSVSTTTNVLRSQPLQRFVLWLMDIVAVGLVFLFAIQMMQSFHPVPLNANVLAMSATALVLWSVMLCSIGAYSLKHTRAGALEYKRAINATVLTGGLIGIACYLLNYDYPRGLFAAWMIGGIILLVAMRWFRRQIMRFLHSRELFVTPVVVVGSSHHVDEIAMVLKREEWTGYRLRGAVVDDSGKATAMGLPVLGRLRELPAIIDATRVPTVIFAEGSFQSSDEFRRLAWQLEQSDVQMILAPTLADVSAERLEFRPVAGLPLVDVARPRAMKSLRWFKRAVDIVGSGVLLVVAAPILAITALAIKLEDGGPVLFRQRRVGLNGKEFDCLKLRSMCTDAEARLAALQAQNEGAGVLFKMKDDPRITRVGKFIRRYSIDELPQLWNAFIGDMSLVGPRPALPREVARYDFDTRRRLHVRPGLTGLWQVSGRSSLSWEDTVRLDLYYVDNWSLVQDLMILLKTFRAVFGKSGAY